MASTTRPEPLQSAPKVNQFGIPLLPEELRERLFAKDETTVGENVLRSAHDLLRKFNLNTRGDENCVPSFSAPEMPPLFGNIESHFHHVAEEQVSPYCRRIEEFIGAALPPLPKKWNYAAGWTRYGPDGN